MALVRCEICGVKPVGQHGYKRTYSRHVEPLGYPETAVVCGVPSCSRPGLIWLEPTEAKEYEEKRKRVFGLQTNTTKIRAK